MPAAYRCSRCGVDWPHIKDYDKCPACDTKTFTLWDGSPLTTAEATSRVRTVQFARHYEQTRGVPVDTDTDPADDPNREAIGMWCDHPDVDGFICWACDQIPRRPDENTDFERGLLYGG